ncbi:alpha/beta fold hydrolase [Nocardia sp. NEAU-G5]|uniref:Alpha/beta fold hydrolase n=1 Tax=Nocardia albiluteola TaxID=2842303 RepID=A0ABS6AUS3_9NOCA|nr:alpha/beta hydrolase [Nocardia albiluteola]MBU3061775.1 alpha/beta fold hydrolase [Nocardia albiluteola]
MRFSAFHRRLVPLAAALTMAGALVTSCSSSHPAAAADPLPGFHDGTIDNDGVAVHYVIGGHGPAIVLLHGYPETWRAWSKIAPDLAKDHTVVAVDLRGMGDSGFAKSDDGYQALAVATDVHALAQHLNLGHFDLFAHDFGGEIALAYADEYRSDLAHLAIMEAAPTTDYAAFAHSRPDFLWFDWLALGPKDQLAEKLIAGKEADFYGALYEAKDGPLDKAETDGYIAAFSRAGRTHAGLEYYREKDAGDKAEDALFAQQGKLTIPVLGLGGQDSMGPTVGAMLARVATNVTTDVVPHADHWVLDENTSYVIAGLRKLLAE